MAVANPNGGNSANTNGNASLVSKITQPFGDVYNAIFGKQQPAVNPATRQPNAAAPNSAAADPTSPSNPNASKIGQDQNGNLPNGQPGNTDAAQSPLAGYEDLFTISPDPKLSQNQEPFTFDEVAFDKNIKNLNISKTINPELIQKALGGDQEAFSQIINSQTQTTVSMLTKLFAKQTKAALAKQRESILKEVPDTVRSTSNRNSLQSDNPGLNNPLVRPILDTIESQLRVKFPEASDADIQNHAKKVMTGLATSITGGNANDKNNDPNSRQRGPNGTDNVDWGEFAGIDLDAA